VRVIVRWLPLCRQGQVSTTSSSATSPRPVVGARGAGLVGSDRGAGGVGGGVAGCCGAASLDLPVVAVGAARPPAEPAAHVAAAGPGSAAGAPVVVVGGRDGGGHETARFCRRASMARSEQTLCDGRHASSSRWVDDPHHRHGRCRHDECSAPDQSRIVGVAFMPCRRAGLGSCSSRQPVRRAMRCSPGSRRRQVGCAGFLLPRGRRLRVSECAPL